MSWIPDVAGFLQMVRSRNGTLVCAFPHASLVHFVNCHRTLPLRKLRSCSTPRLFAIFALHVHDLWKGKPWKHGPTLHPLPPCGTVRRTSMLICCFQSAICPNQIDHREQSPHCVTIRCCGCRSVAVSRDQMHELLVSRGFVRRADAPDLEEVKASEAIADAAAAAARKERADAAAERRRERAKDRNDDKVGANLMSSVACVKYVERRL